MDIKIVENVPMSEYEKMLTYHKYAWLVTAWSQIHKVITVVAMDSDETVRGYCVFIIENYREKTAILLYVFTAEDYRNQGVATEMIKKGIFQLNDWGYTTVALSSREEYPTKLYENLGFRVSKVEYNMVFEGKTLLTSKVGKDLEKMGAYRKNVKKESQLSPVEKKRFKQTVLGTKLRVDVDKSDPELTRYYVDKEGRVVAYMSICSDMEGNIMNLDIYQEHVPEAKTALPCIMVDVLYERKEQGLLKDDTWFAVTTTSEQNVNVLRSTFGEPKTVYANNVMIN